MTTEGITEFYDRQYRLYGERRSTCPHSIHDLAKAQRRVASLQRAFGLKALAPGAQVLDVGCGLGYYTRALAGTGAQVTGIDSSTMAIKTALATFPQCDFVHASWPNDIAHQKYDLIWMVNFSLMNTFDVEYIREHIVMEAVNRLKPHGALVVGWNSDFSGRKVGNYSHWPLRMLQTMRTRCNLSPPVVAEARTRWFSRTIIAVALLSKRSIPIFMIRRKLYTYLLSTVVSVTDVLLDLELSVLAI